MAATCREVVKAALRKLGVADPRREPSAIQSADALASLKSLYEEWITNGAFGQLRDVQATSDLTAWPNTRIVKQTSAIVVTLPRVGLGDYAPSNAPDWPLWDYGFLRMDPRLLDMAAVSISNLENDAVEQWVYDARGNRWVSIESLTLDSAAPLATRGVDGLAAVLATRIADEYGDAATLSGATVAAATRFTTSILTRPSTVRPANYGAGDYM